MFISRLLLNGTEYISGQIVMTSFYPFRVRCHSSKGILLGGVTSLKEFPIEGWKIFFWTRLFSISPSRSRIKKIFCVVIFGERVTPNFYHGSDLIISLDTFLISCWYEGRGSHVVPFCWALHHHSVCVCFR